MNLAQNLVNTAQLYPQKIALRTATLELSYAAFLARARTMAQQLAAAGIGEGAMVGLIAPNGLAFPIAFYGALTAGATTIPMNPLMADRELKFYLQDTAANLVIVERSVLVKVEKCISESGVRMLVVDEDGFVLEPATVSEKPVWCERDGSEMALVLYTSGTTGNPKGAMLTHFNLSSNASTTAQTLLEATAEDVIMGCLPLFHVFALSCVLNAAITCGATVSFMERFDGQNVLERIRREGVSVFIGVPTMYVALLDCEVGDEPKNIRTALCGGAPMPVEVLQEFERRFECPVYEGYGLSETAPVACFNRPEVGKKIGSIGLPVRGMELRLIADDGNDVGPDEIGEIAIRGEGLMKGYLNRPDATAEAIRDTWFRSGDLGKRDAEGFYYIVDRKKRMIIRGGYNVYPREIEEVLYEYPAVKEAAVVGVKHPFFGEEVAAAIVLRVGHELDTGHLEQFCRERLSPYKCPRIVWTVDALPKNATGKILHRAVEVPTELLPLG